MIGKLINISNLEDIDHGEFAAGIILINYLQEENTNEFGEIIDPELEDKIDSAHSCLETAYGVSKGNFEFGHTMENFKAAVSDLASFVNTEAALTLIQET